MADDLDPFRSEPAGRLRSSDVDLRASAGAGGGDLVSGEVRRRRRGRHARGHEPHWIQVKHAAADPEPATRVRLVGVEGDDLLIVRGVGTRTVRAFCSHEAPAVVDAVGGVGRVVEVQDRWSLLHAGGRVWSVCRYGAAWTPC